MEFYVCSEDFIDVFVRHLFCSAPPPALSKNNSIELCEGVNECCVEAMDTYDLVLLVTFWYMLKSVPGLMPFIGYFFGFVLASWAFDQYFRHD